VAFALDPLALTPYRLFTAPSPATLGTALAPVAALAVVGVWLFKPAESEADAGRHRRLEAVLARLAPDALTRRPLLAVSRSSGSIGKVVFSMGVLFAVVALVLDRVSAATGLEPAAGVAFGALLGLGAFTTYSWVSVFDDPREYLRYPIGYEQVFAGKRRAYLLLSVGAGLGYLALATLWYPASELIVGAVVLPLVAVYVFGVAAYLTGLAPNELLFDTPLFLVFGAALAAVALPLLVAALASPAAPTLATVVAVAVSLVAGLLGVGLHRLAGPRWDERLVE
jgi:TM2 domain-containing membrane protein YozV